MKLTHTLLTAIISCSLLLGGTTAMAQTREEAAQATAQSLFTKNNPVNIKKRTRAFRHQRKVHL